MMQNRRNMYTVQNNTGNWELASVLVYSWKYNANTEQFVFHF